MRGLCSEEEEVEEEVDTIRMRRASELAGTRRARARRGLCEGHAVGWLFELRQQCI